MQKVWRTSPEDIITFFDENNSCPVKYSKLRMLIGLALFTIFFMMIVTLHYDQLTDHSIFPSRSEIRDRSLLVVLFMYGSSLYVIFHCVRGLYFAKKFGPCVIEFDRINLRIVNSVFSIADIKSVYRKDDLFEGIVIYIELNDGKIDKIKVQAAVSGLREFFSI